MGDLSVTGGAQIGWMNASWPLAKLCASVRNLTLSVFLLGKYEFTPEQIVSIEPYGSISFLRRGIRLNHNRPDYPAKLIFWTMGSSIRLLDTLRDAGFNPAGPASSLINRRGFPLRWSAVIILLLAWNIPFLLNTAAEGQFLPAPDSIMLFPLGGAFVLSWALLRSARLQNLILKEGHFIGEIRSILLLLRVVSGFIFVVFAGMLIATNAV